MSNNCKKRVRLRRDNNHRFITQEKHRNKARLTQPMPMCSKLCLTSFSILCAKQGSPVSRPEDQVTVPTPEKLVKQS